MKAAASVTEEGLTRQRASRPGLRGACTRAWRDEQDAYRLLWPGAAAFWRLKTACMIGLITTFFAGYFLLLDHPLFAVTPMPETGLDDLIGFSPSALPVYLTLWAYLSLPPGLLHHRRDLLRYYAGIIALALAGMTAFLLWPTASPRPDIDWTLYPVFGPLLAADHAGNACPSLHAAFAVFTAIWFDRLLRRAGPMRLSRTLNALWCLGILYATLATKQHVAVDVYAGMALGLLVALLHGRWLGYPSQYPSANAAGMARECEPHEASA